MITKKRRTKAEKQMDDAVSAAAQRACTGHSIPIMRLSEISDAGRKAALAGEDIDAACQAAVANIEATSK